MKQVLIKMLVMLRAVINEGTGGRVRRLYGITADMGGKTGTTNRNSDGWFMDSPLIGIRCMGRW